jgi:hypothetical protein
VNTHAYCNGRGSARGRGRSDCGMGMPRRMSRVVSAPCCGCIPRHLESASELGKSGTRPGMALGRRSKLDLGWTEERPSSRSKGRSKRSGSTRSLGHAYL